MPQWIAISDERKSGSIHRPLGHTRQESGPVLVESVSPWLEPSPTTTLSTINAHPKRGLSNQLFVPGVIKEIVSVCEEENGVHQGCVRVSALHIIFRRITDCHHLRKMLFRFG